VEISSNGDIVAVTANKLILGSNAEINYDLGLTNSIFTSGPSGGYKIDSWKEIE